MSSTTTAIGALLLLLCCCCVLLNDIVEWNDSTSCLLSDLMYLIFSLEGLTNGQTERNLKGAARLPFLQNMLDLFVSHLPAMLFFSCRSMVRPWWRRADGGGGRCAPPWLWYMAVEMLSGARRLAGAQASAWRGGVCGNAHGWVRSVDIAST